ncbi:hypothetical protein FALBO_9663 [Fusarium albosuccineum]|uniref:Myb-like domain-containing protein n=1 Tax=Fusarium albosuccineum TaxID=1237068 RepID=A0A8H4P5R0_9HYPO|nr:hypothetical protein FALBO_9663 [Fusarium albosuccineum]
MASTASDADQQWLRQSCTPPIFHADTPPSCDGEALSDLGASQDTAIVIPEDSDTEDEDYGGEYSHSPQSYITTATSIVTHFESPVGVEGGSIWTHDSRLDPPADPEPNARTLCQINTTSTASVDFGNLSINMESPSWPTMTDEQLITEAIPDIPTTSEPAKAIDSLSDEETCEGSKDVPVTPSRSTYSPTTTTPEVTAQAPPSDSEACPSAERDDATRVHIPCLSPGLSPESPPDQAQDQDRKSCSSSGTESGSSEAESGSLLGTQTCPPSCEGLSGHRSRRTSLRTREVVQDEDGEETDTEDTESEDGLDVPQRGRDQDYCPSSPEAQRYDSEVDHEDEELNRRKRRKLSLSPYALPLGALSSRQIQSPRSTAQSPRRHRTSYSPAMPRTDAGPSDVDTCISRFEEWPLSNVCLKRITEGNKTTFQLQFEWTPESNRPHAQISVPHPKDRELALASTPRTTSSGGKWTTEEENIVRSMRHAGRSWDEIHCALPHRSQGTIQVRYSTKLKHLPNSM